MHAGRLPKLVTATTSRHAGEASEGAVATAADAQAAIGREGDRQAAGPTGKLVERVRGHVDSANDLLQQSHQAAQRAAIQVERTYRRVQRIDRRVEHTSGAANEAYQAASATADRFMQVKQRELTAHLEALKVHERAAELQDQLGHPDRAADARAHAEYARELYRLACEELADYEARIAAAKEKLARSRRRSP